MQQAMIIINPSSGKEDALEYISQAEEILQNNGYMVTVNETAKKATLHASALLHAGKVMSWSFPSAATARSMKSLTV